MGVKVMKKKSRRSIISISINEVFSDTSAFYALVDCIDKMQAVSPYRGDV